MEKEARDVIKAWESLSEGSYGIKTIQRWILYDMKPAIDNLRIALGLPTEGEQ